MVERVSLVGTSMGSVSDLSQEESRYSDNLLMLVVVVEKKVVVESTLDFLYLLLWHIARNIEHKQTNSLADGKQGRRSNRSIEDSEGQ